MTSRDRADFRAHVRLARRHALQRRLNVAALLLFTLALLTWAFSVPLVAQLLIVTAGTLAGFALPVRNAQGWSRAWIRSHAGLAYDTALQLGDSVRDEFGLRVTVRAHARTALARMDQPQQQPWWLAGIVLGLLILLLPSLQFNPPWSGPPAGSVPPALQEDAGSMTAEAEDDNSVQELQAELEAPQPETAAQPDSRSEAPAGQAGETGEGGADSAVLDRFLDHLREQPADSADAAGSPDSQSGGEQPLGSRAETAEGEEPAEGEGNSAGESSAAGGSRELQDEAAEGEGSQGGAGAEEDGSEGESAAAEAAGMEEAAAEAEGRGAAGSQDDSALQPEAGAGASGDGESGQAGVDSGEPGGEGAGADAGIELPGSEDRLSGPRAAPEFLEGELAGGSSSAGGSVRLPGFSDVELPGGSSAAEYGRAAERAVTEGQIPVEYQDIIRDYFRP